MKRSFQCIPYSHIASLSRRIVVFTASLCSLSCSLFGAIGAEGKAKNYAAFADGLPEAGYTQGDAALPDGAGLEDVSKPTTVVGTGTPASVTAQAFIAAVKKGGIIIFNTGGKPAVIALSEPAKVFNNAADTVVIDGGGLITLDGGGTTRILYMNTCDPDQVWTTPHCDNQATPRLTVQNLTFRNGNASKDLKYGGGGAIYAQGGRLKIVNCRFFNNSCADTGPDVGGGAVRAFQQYQNLPVFVTHSTFGGAARYGNRGSNGGALSSIGVSWTIINSVLSHNSAIGNGGNPAKSGTPGGGSGGAIYNDGNTMKLRILDCLVEENSVNAFGSAIFFVSNNHTGSMEISGSVFRNNKGGSWYPWPKYPGISGHGDTPLKVTDSTFQ